LRGDHELRVHQPRVFRLSCGRSDSGYSTAAGTVVADCVQIFTAVFTIIRRSVCLFVFIGPINESIAFRQRLAYNIPEAVSRCRYRDRMYIHNIILIYTHTHTNTHNIIIYYKAHIIYKQAVNPRHGAVCFETP